MLTTLKRTGIIITYLIRYVVWRIQNSKTISHRQIELEDCQLHYKIFGSGEPLVLLHGGLTSIEAWLCQLPVLSRHFRIVAIDARGHGRSSIGEKAFSYRLLAKDVVAILNQENIARAHVAGWSDGGNTGLVMSVFYPARVLKVIAISANYHPDGLLKSAPDATCNSSKPRWLSASQWWHWLLSKKNHLWLDLRMRTHTMWQNYPQLTDDSLSQIESPVLILLGENDLISIEHAREMEKHVPKAKLIVVKNSGHNLLFEEPRLITDLIKKFISESI